MQSEHSRYFIELRPAETEPLPRNREAEVRREQATHFIAAIYDWLKNHDLGDKVSDMDVTMFGQVQITCDSEIITKMRSDEDLSIAMIRPGAQYVEGIGQLAQMTARRG